MGTRSTGLLVSELADRLGVTVQAIHLHVGKGLPYTKDSRGCRLFDEKQARKWLAEHGSTHSNGNNKLGAFAGVGEADARDGIQGDPNSPINVELRLKLAKIAEIEIKNDRARGVLVNAADLETLFKAHLASARLAFESVPTKASSRVIAAAKLDHTLQGVISEAIKAVIDDTMLVLSAWKAK